MKQLLLFTAAAAASLSTTGCALDGEGGVAGDELDEVALSETAQAATYVTCTGFVAPFYRYNNNAVGDHLYTTNFNELGNGANGYVLEGTAGKLLSSVFTACGAVPLYRYFNIPGTDHFYTTNPSEGAGLAYEGVPGYCFPSPVQGLVPLYRYFSAAAFDHFYTTNFAELGLGAAGFRYEGVQCYVAP